MGIIADRERGLFAEWALECPGLIPDGLVVEEQYCSSPRKLLFLMKEVNGGENWDLRDFLRQGGRPATWDNIARWVQGLYDLSREYPWSELERDNEARRLEMLKRICVVNVKKTSGTHISNGKQISYAASQNAARLKRQLDIYQPELIVCCGTERQYAEIMGAWPDWHMTSRGILYTREAGRTVISYTHPEARVRDCLLYYGLIDAAREIFRAV